MVIKVTFVLCIPDCRFYLVYSHNLYRNESGLPRCLAVKGRTIPRYMSVGDRLLLSKLGQECMGGIEQLKEFNGGWCCGKSIALPLTDVQECQLPFKG